MEKKLNATYDQDSKRFHRFLIDDGQGVTGAIYGPKQGTVPDSVVVRLGTQADKADEEKPRKTG